MLALLEELLLGTGFEVSKDGDSQCLSLPQGCESRCEPSAVPPFSHYGV